ncbi:multidrug effflux MFS transporter [Pseudochelatococcus contaminans]|uniref:Bcr/CflA family efflux transporter n=1 Tax=Pseudochelatococcus contaminans TaxID=1538103 RepID=A0A7W6EFI6_9HYPH|nr:multidrug effflux MFS transporter [Pseudochelatococcus contaminans]MBB3808806.1 DHA1 family bicyclomycin/chloramphenicol resistance-like MFS transporter [Pseudochelatococcus contaminans]
MEQKLAPSPKLTLAESLPLVIILGVVTAFDAMAIDMYLPAFGDIGRSLNTDAGTLQTSLSVFLIGLAVGQFFYGPLTDRFGRRAPLVAGIVLFIAASVLIAVAQDMTTFMIGRVLQGLGGAAGLVIPRAIVADLYEPRESAKVFSMLMQVMMVAPIAAPPIGGLLLGAFGWRSIFWVLAGIGVLAVFATMRVVPEPLPPAARSKSGIISALMASTRVLRLGRFSAFALSGAFTLAGMFVYIGSSAFIFVDYFGLTPTVYSFIFAAIAIGEILFGYVNIRLLNRWRERQILPIGLAIHAGFVALLVAALLAGFDSLIIVVLLLFLSLVSLSLIFGNVTALVMESAPGNSGSASSLYGVLQYVFAGAVGGLLGLVHNGTLIPPAAVMLVCAIGAMIAWWIAERSSPTTPASTRSTAELS